MMLPPDELIRCGANFGPAEAVEAAEELGPVESESKVELVEAPPAFPHHAPPLKPEAPRFPDTPQLMSGDVLDVATRLFDLLREDGFERPDDPADYLTYLKQVLADRQHLSEVANRALAKLESVR